jgi:hydroxymethylpyrimidine pyrophosphatase-like HAD family hydrolase
MSPEKTFNYTNTDMYKMLKKRLDSGKPLILALTDVDNTVRVLKLHPKWWESLHEIERHKTLVSLGFSQNNEILSGNDPGDRIREKREQDLKNKSFELINFAHEQDIPYGYVTGADIDKVLKRIYEQKKDLPMPLAIASAVGTEIYFKIGEEFVEDKRYQRELRSRYERKIMVNIGKKLLENKKFSQPFDMGGYELHFQPNQRDQTDYKVSFYLFAKNFQEVEVVAESFQKEIEALNRQRKQRELLPPLAPRILYAAEIEWNSTCGTAEKKKYCIDLLAGTKDDAINYIVQKMNEVLPQDTPPINLLVAGDSGNDEALLRSTHIPSKEIENQTFFGNVMAVIVGGSDEELEKKMEKVTVPANKEKPYILHLKKITDHHEEKNREIHNGLNYNRLYKIDERGPETVKRALIEFDRQLNYDII